MARNRPKESITCTECGSEFMIVSSEKKRQLKSGRTGFFCKMSCHAKHNNKKKHPSHAEAGRKSLEKARSEGKIPMFDPLETAMRFYFRISKQRKYLENDLNVDFLMDLWKKQHGNCAVTGMSLKLKSWYKIENKGNYTKNSLNSASLDRVDSSKGYVMGNVQFIAYGLNLAKSTFTNKEVLEFLEQIRCASG